MKTFEEWLAEYTQTHGTPPAHVMAEAAWNYAKEHAYNYGWNEAISMDPDYNPYK